MADAKANIWVQLKGAKQAQTQMQILGMTLKNNIASFVSLGTAALVLGKIAKDAFKLAAEAEGVERAFKRLNQPNLLKGLKDATRGTVSDLELMKQAVRAENFQIPLDQMATLLEFAQKRARATGESVNYLTESIVMGIGRKSPMILDNLGISIVKVREEFAKTGDMAEAVGNIAREELDKMGDGADTAADKTERLTASWDNFSLALGRTLTQTSPMADFFSTILEGATAFVSGGLGTGLQEQFDKFNGVVKNSNEVSEEHGKQVEKIVTEYEKWVLKQEMARLEAEQLAEWTAKYNQELIKQLGLQTELTDTYDNVNSMVIKYVDTIEKIPLIEQKSVKMSNKSYEEIMYKYQRMGDFANQFSSMWSQALLNQWNEGQSFFDNMVRGFQQMLAAMAAELMAKAAIFGIFNLLTGGTFGLAQGGLGKFLGFASGGSFTVGGSGGTDSQPVAFMATPGERVIVQTPDQQRAGETINIVFNNPIMDKRYTEQMLIPMIKKAVRQGMA